MLEIQAPEHVAAGQAITVTIAVRGARSVAGWEARVRFDASGAEFGRRLGTRRRHRAARQGSSDPPVRLRRRRHRRIYEQGAAARAAAHARARASAPARHRHARVSRRRPPPRRPLRSSPRRGHEVTHSRSPRRPGRRRLPPPRRRSCLERPHRSRRPLRLRDLDGDGLVLVRRPDRASLGLGCARETGAVRAAETSTQRLRRRLGHRARRARRPAASLHRSFRRPTGSSPSTRPATTPTRRPVTASARRWPAPARCARRSTEANRQPGPDTIAFNIPGSGVADDPGHEPAAHDQRHERRRRRSTATRSPAPRRTPSPLVDNAVLQVQIRGTGRDARVLRASSSPRRNNVVRGLSIFNGRPIVHHRRQRRTTTASSGNFIGTDATGTFAVPTQLRNCAGIELARGASQQPDRRARTSPTATSSRAARSPASTSPTTARTATRPEQHHRPEPVRRRARVRNQRMGVDINLGASQNLIGGTGAARAQRHLGQHRRRRRGLAHHRDTVGNQIIGNFIGTDLTGNRDPSFTHNSEQGMHVEDGVQNTLISGNVIGDNLLGGHHRRGRPRRPGRGSRTTTSASRRTARHAERPRGHPDPVPRPRAHDHRQHDRERSRWAFASTTPTATSTRSPGTASSRTARGLGIDLAPIGAVNPNDADDVDAGREPAAQLPGDHRGRTQRHRHGLRRTAPSRCSSPTGLRAPTARARRSSPRASPRPTASFSVPIGSGNGGLPHHRHGDGRRRQHVGVRGQRARRARSAPASAPAAATAATSAAPAPGDDDRSRRLRPDGRDGFGTADTGGTLGAHRLERRLRRRRLRRRR